ncbi:MAG TPA: PBP1A family penicillin-binding protein [Pyrinomonadaceae bacterium]|nr:PBP1A family penicillin-binding protein [Pyrinomonadaceae bacterium]
MPIEVTSVPDKGRPVSIRRILDSVCSTTSKANKFQILRSMLGLLAIVSVLAADSIVRSYKYHSRVIDARLAAGYSHSRAGLYAAPREISPGTKISKENLIASLQRAGYVSVQGSNAWSGSYREDDSTVEITPAPARTSGHANVLVKFDDSSTISEIISDGLPSESYTLEPELLSSDTSFKAGQKQTLLYDDIPAVVIQAILSIEDQRFFAHGGLDPFGIARAMLQNVGKDRIDQGGSTITQQLVKNTYLSSERTLRRKYSEAMLAFALENRLSKPEILALYCNEVFLGQRGAVAARGVKEAAQLYFAKELSQLTLSEAATLAGMIQSPARYSPLHNPAAAQSRRNTVLDAMVRDGWIKGDEALRASKEPIVLASHAKQQSVAPYFIDYVNRTAASELDASSGRQRIYTTIDLQLQQLAEKAVKRQLDRLGGDRRNMQAALVAMDPKTGHVLAMVGGRDYGKSQLNRATDARRQPGSTFKPFVYAAALEDGMSPVRMFADAPREFVYDRNKTYRPGNYGNGYSMRDVTMRTALVNSLNVVTVDVALQTGLARIANVSESFGLPRPERYPSLALGTKEVTPLELAAAYAALANGGRRIRPKVITSVDDPPAEHATYEDAPQVVSETTSYMITNMLSATFDHGTARSARNLGRVTAVAGKTGTSRDGWFAGYTPNLVCVVWIGYDDNDQLGLTGAEAALPAWSEFIKEAVTLRPELGGRNFECPEGISFVEIDADHGAISTVACPHRELIAVTDRLAPNLECLAHSNVPNESNFDQHSSYDGLETLLTQNRPRVPFEIPKRNSTRVEVDSTGKETLVNAMR